MLDSQVGHRTKLISMSRLKYRILLPEAISKPGPEEGKQYWEKTQKVLIKKVQNQVALAKLCDLE